MSQRTLTTFSLLVLAALLSACTTTNRSQSTAATQRAEITVLYDAFGKDAAMTKDWGYSALVEINGKRILFDTGGDPAIFAKNVKAKGVDLTKLDFVVLSHRHTDHVGGVSYLLKVNPKVKIYAPTDGIGGLFGSDLPSYRKDEALPAQMRYYEGGTPEIKKLRTVFTGANIQLIDMTTELVPGITLIARVSDVPGTKEMKELSLAINTADGIVLVVGCAHPGIEGIVAEAVKINPRIHLIAGGFHLVAAQDPAIEKIVATLHDTYRVDYIAPGHCTGEPTFAALRKGFGDHYLYAGLGTVLSLDARPHPLSATTLKRPSALDSQDRATYEALYAHSVDARDSTLFASVF